MVAGELLDGLVAWSPRVTAWLLTYLVHSTALLGAVWLVTRFAVRSDGWRDLLWKTALVGGIITATVQRSVDFTPLGGKVALERPVAAAVAPANAPDVETGRDAAPPAPLLPESPATSSEQAAGRQAGSGAAFPLPLSALPMLAWLAVGAWLGLGLVVGRLRLSVRLADRTPVTDAELLGMVDTLRHATGMRRRVRMTRTNELTSPIALGFAEICVPDAAITELDREQQRGLVAHELGHLARLDPFWLLLAGFLERVFFFQPLNRLARRRIQEAAEYLCDEWAVRRTGAGISLAKCLVKVAEWLDAKPSTTPVAGMAEDRSHLVARVRRLIEERTPPRQPRRRLLAPVATGMLGLTVLAIPGVTAVRRAAADHVATDPAVMVDPRAEHDPDAESAAEPAAEPAEMRLSAERGPAEERLDRDAALWQAQEPAGRRQDTTVVAALIAALRDPDVEVRRAVVRALGNHKDSRAVAALAQALRDSDPEVRAGAIDALDDLGDKRNARDLIGALSDSSVEVRRAAARAVADLETPDAVEPLMRALNDADAEVRAAAVDGLADLEDRRAVPGLIAALQDRSADVRREAAHALGHLGDSRASDPLAGVLGDASADVRRSALEALGELELEALPDGVIASLADADPEVRRAAVEAVSEHRDARAVPRLGRLIQDASPDVREAAVEALAEIRTDAAIELIVAALKSDDPNVRKAAADALGKR